MSTLIKQLQLYVKSVALLIFSKHSSSDKFQESLQVKENPPLYQSQSSPVQNVDMSTNNSNQKKVKNWNSKYSGLQEEIYFD